MELNRRELLIYKIMLLCAVELNKKGYEVNLTHGNVLAAFGDSAEAEKQLKANEGELKDMGVTNGDA